MNDRKWVVRHQHDHRLYLNEDGVWGELAKAIVFTQHERNTLDTDGVWIMDHRDKGR